MKFPMVCLHDAIVAIVVVHDDDDDIIDDDDDAGSGVDDDFVVFKLTSLMYRLCGWRRLPHARYAHMSQGI
jgi:hypothetical protein